MHVVYKEAKTHIYHLSRLYSFVVLNQFTSSIVGKLPRVRLLCFLFLFFLPLNVIT